VTRAKHAGAILAIDHGTKRTGFAVADALRITAQALDVWEMGSSRRSLLDHVAQLLAERSVATIVVGLPLNMDGSEGGRAAQVKAFARELAVRFPELEIVAYDERLTTKAAEELLREAGHHGQARKIRRDSWSALVILRDWIDSGEPR
jgi:putative Holliday junction resolvase